MNRLFILFISLIFFFSCKEEILLEPNTDVQFNVRVNGAEIPVWVRGNTQSKKIIVYVNGGPGLPVLDDASLDLMNFKTIEKDFAIAYYDQRGTGNSQGKIKKASLTLTQYSKDLEDIIAVLKSQYQDPNIYLMSHGFGGFLASFYLLNHETDSSVTAWVNIDGAMIIDDKTEWAYRHTFLVNIATEEIILGNQIDHWNSALTWAANNPKIETDAQKSEWRNFIGDPGGFIIPPEERKIKTREVFKLWFNFSYNPFPAYLSQNQKITGEALSQDANGSNLLFQLHRVTLPSLFIWGRYDDLVPPELGSDAFDKLGTPTADKFYSLYANSGYQPFFNEPDKLTDEVIDFVGKY